MMNMSPGLRKFTLMIHVSASVGWIGVVLAYLVLVAAASTSQSMQLLRACWVVMNLIGWFALVPLSVVALLTGLIMALGTKWGVFRHYWVVFSFVLTIVATVVLLQHMQTVSILANMVAEAGYKHVDMLRDGLRGELLHAGGGMLVLLAVQVLNVYKPRGVTPYGWRKQQEQQTASRATTS